MASFPPVTITTSSSCIEQAFLYSSIIVYILHTLHIYNYFLEAHWHPCSFFIWLTLYNIWEGSAWLTLQWLHPAVLWYSYHFRHSRVLPSARSRQARPSWRDCTDTAGGCVKGSRCRLWTWHRRCRSQDSCGPLHRPLAQSGCGASGPQEGREESTRGSRHGAEAPLRCREEALHCLQWREWLQQNYSNYCNYVLLTSITHYSPISAIATPYNRGRRPNIMLTVVILLCLSLFRKARLIGDCY